MRTVKTLLQAAAACLLLLAMACGDLSQVVDIPLPEHEPLPAVTVDLRSGDTAVYARVALSRGVLDPETATDLTAWLALTRDGEPVVEREIALDRSDGRTSELPLPAALPGAAADYRLSVRVGGFQEVTAEQRMPAPFTYRLVSYEADGAVDADGYRVDEMKLDLDDDGATTDYYGVRLVTRPGDALNCYQVWTADDDTWREVCDTFYNDRTEELYLTSQDPVLKPSSGYGMVFTDDAFNGTTYRVRVLADNYDRAPLRLEVYRLTEDAYRYALSRQAYEDAGDNPFAEPVNVHQNVDGGYGHFIVAQRQSEELER